MREKRVRAEEGEDQLPTWDENANNAPQQETRVTLLEAAREGVAPVGRRPERACKRTVPYGR